MEPKYIYKRFNVAVTAPDTNFPKKFDLDKNIKVVRAIQITSNRPNLLFYRGSQRIEVSGEELFPEDYESKMLMSGISVAPDERFVEVGDIQAGNGEVKINYKDASNPEAAFSPYVVSLVLKCELK
jgi:hypothetical protein